MRNLTRSPRSSGTVAMSSVATIKGAPPRPPSRPLRLAPCSPPSAQWGAPPRRPPRPLWLQSLVPLLVLTFLSSHRLTICPCIFSDSLRHRRHHLPSFALADTFS